MMHDTVGFVITWLLTILVIVGVIRICHTDNLERRERCWNLQKKCVLTATWVFFLLYVTYVL